MTPTTDPTGMSEEVSLSSAEDRVVVESSSPTLELDAVRAGYREASGETRVLVERIDLAIIPGDVVGLWGRSGTGKSSLIRYLAGLTRPLAGTVRYHSPDGDMMGKSATSAILSWPGTAMSISDT